jgi:hypothetical protein
VIYKSAEGGKQVEKQYEALLNRWPVEYERRSVEQAGHFLREWVEAMVDFVDPEGGST